MTRAALALVLAIASTACTGSGKRVGSSPSWRPQDKHGAAKKAAGPITFAPTSEAATNYNEPVQAPPKSPLGDLVNAALKESASKQNLPTPIADARLFRACAELAAIVPEDGIFGQNEVVMFALQRHGIVEPSPYLLVVWGVLDEHEDIVRRLSARIPEILADGAHSRFGIGSAKRSDDGTGAIVFALQASSVTTNPIPRQLPAAGKHVLDVVVDVRFKDPELFITREDGNTEQVKIAVGKSGAFKASLDCGKHIGRQQVEITASDKQGSTVLANFPVWCGEAPPTSFTFDTTQGDNEAVAADEAERRLLALVNRDRERAGLRPLLWDDRVMLVSRKHSEDMQKTKIVAHISPTTGSAADRIKVASIRTALVLENVARAYGVGEAHTGFMSSPGHRANVLSSLATHIGIGVVLGEEVSGFREMFVTQVFIRIPPKVDPVQAVVQVHDLINRVHPVKLNAELNRVAQDLAVGIASGKTREALWPGVKKRLDLMNGFASIGSSVSAAADLATLEGKDFVDTDAKVDDIGVGIAQGGHPEIGEGAIYIVVMTAKRLKK